MTPGDAPIESFDGLGRWHVVRVQSREEKHFADFMFGAGIPYFLPLQRVWKQDRERRRAVWKALFAGYSFFIGGDTERYRVLDCGLTIGGRESVISVLSCVRQERLRDDLIRIRAQQLAKPELATELLPGTPARVIGGNWQGREGYIERDTGRAFVVFRSEIFGDSSTPFEIEREYIEVIDA